MNLLTYIDGYLAPSLLSRASETELLKARTTVALSLLYISSLLFVVITLGVLSALELVVVWETVIGGAIAASCYVLQLVVFRKTGNLFLGANMVMVIMFAATTSFIALTRGWASPVMLVYVCVPMCAFLMEGKRSGILWVSAVACSYGMFLMLDNWQVTLPNVIDAKFDQYLIYCSWAYSWSIIVGGIFLYATIVAKLNESLNEEREKMRIRATYDALTGALTRAAFKKVLLRHIPATVKHQAGFLFLDLEFYTEEPLSRRQEERLLQNAVKIMREAYVERIDIGRAGGLSFLILVDDVDESINATEIIMVLQQALSVLGVPVNIGAVLVPEYSIDSEKIFSGGRKAVREARLTQERYCLYDSAANRNVEDEFKRNWVRVRYKDMKLA